MTEARSESMRVFYASPASPNPDIQSSLWRSNLLASLEEMEHEVVEFDYDLAEIFKHLDSADPESASFIARERPKITAELLRQVESAHHQEPLDIFFSSSVRLKVEQNQLVSSDGWFWWGSIGLQGA